MDAHLSGRTDSAVMKAVTQTSDPILWGFDDCCMWVGRIIKEVTGVDICEPFGHYKSKEQAQEAMDRYAGEPATVALVAVLRARELKLRAAPWPYRGRLVGVVSSKYGPVLAIRFNDRWLARGELGIWYTSNQSAVMAWEWPECLTSPQH